MPEGLCICGNIRLMAKKNQNKKHKFKYTEPTGASVASARPASSATDAPNLSKANAAATARDFSYVGKDLRRIVVFALGLIALELALWGLLGHTSLGDAVFRFVQV